MAQEVPSPNGDLERFREYLALLVRLQLDIRLQGKVDLSGIVQQTLLETHQARDQFQELGDAQKTAWLRRSLANNLTDEVRKLSTAARDISRERSVRSRAGGVGCAARGLPGVGTRAVYTSTHPPG